MLPQATTIGSSTTAGLAPHLTSLLSERGVSHLVSYARGSWQLSHQAAVTGTRPIAVAALTIPAAGSVDVQLINMPESNNATIYMHLPGTLAGIPGALSSLAGSPTWTFTRSTPGAAVNVPEGTEFTPTPLQERRRDVIFLNPGKNTITQNLADWGVERQIILAEKMADDLGIAEGRVLFIGHFVNTATSADHATRTKINKFNDHFAAKYGERYFDLNGYLTSTQVWTDTGVTPTQADLDEQALGNKPPSLSSDNGHLNTVGYTAVAARLVDRAASLGWIPPAPPAQWVTTTADSFDRPDGPLGTTTTGNKAWGTLGSAGLLRIVGGVPALPESGVSSFGVIEPDSADYRVSVDLVSLAASPSSRNVRLVARAADSQNFYFATPRQSASTEGTALWRMVSNTPTMLGMSTRVLQGGEQLSLEVDGSTLRVLVDGEELIVRTDTTFPATGKAGIYMATGTQSAGSVLDNFELAMKPAA
ncbi:hypothetical protein MYP14_04740 [Rhodococcus pyridinivorans]|uniref:hypothetical protein n=1 Tax=Rhodococcus pyridinivorans TaxID=103816 RepID=UPI001FFFFE8A|nr:hypothetical protein [Rhodococcus pyridinivorans]UPK64674.1 hypothetical protein MYP14_04740 [Rhodococcus pyridinivorans]